LNFIDQTLINAGQHIDLKSQESNDNIKSLSINVSGGNLSLYEYHASITENADSYTIRLNIEQVDYNYIPPFNMMNRPEGFRETHLAIIFDISKSDGRLSGIANNHAIRA